MSMFLLSLKVGYFKEYLNLIKKTIDEDTKKLNVAHQELIASGVKTYQADDGYEWDPRDQLADEAFEIDQIEQLMYRTHLMGVFSFIEDQINHTCRAMHRYDKLPITYKDLGGTGISRSIKYLETFTRNNFPKDQTVKEDLEMAKIIRNSLIHHDGFIEDKDLNKVKAYITKHPEMFSLTTLNEVKITYRYNNFLIDLSEKINKELEQYDKSPW